MIGIDALEKTGKYEIALKDDSDYLNDKSSLNVISKKFPHSKYKSYWKKQRTWRDTA
ncbi:MAG: hypothetical protein MZV70_01705 [Desulfobacterales bacterium]|nr:hypothetical protein [Desulfobacterales bacterium]